VCRPEVHGHVSSLAAQLCIRSGLWPLGFPFTVKGRAAEVRWVTHRAESGEAFKRFPPAEKISHLKSTIRGFRCPRTNRSRPPDGPAGGMIGRIRWIR
jgi:hypothetical protein